MTREGKFIFNGLVLVFSLVCQTYHFANDHGKFKRIT